MYQPLWGLLEILISAMPEEPHSTKQQASFIHWHQYDTNSYFVLSKNIHSLNGAFIFDTEMLSVLLSTLLNLCELNTMTTTIFKNTKGALSKSTGR